MFVWFRWTRKYIYMLVILQRILCNDFFNDYNYQMRIFNAMKTGSEDIENEKPPDYSDSAKISWKSNCSGISVKKGAS